MDFGIGLLIFVCLANLILGTVVMFRNPRSSVMRAFFAISIFISLWAVTNYLTENATNLTINRIASRFAYFFGLLAIIATAFFSGTFTKRTKRRIRSRYVLIAFAVFMSILSMTSYVAGSVDRVEERLVFRQGPLVYLYVGSILYCIYLIIKDFRYLISKGSHSQRSQAIIMVYSLTASIAIGVTTNVILPGFTKNYDSTKFGPAILSLFLISTMTYAIIKHKVFNIRLVIARALGYLLSVVALGTVYGVIAFSLINEIIFSGVELTILQRATYTTLAVIIAFTFQPLRRFFDKTTNSIFYRDAYDSQSFLGSLNKELVSTVDLKRMLILSSKVIESSIKSEYCVFGIQQMVGNNWRVIGGVGKSLHSEDVESIKQLVSLRKDKIIVADYLTNEDAQLQQRMRKNDLAVIARLATDTSSNDVGYILLGPKKSGNPYGSQDIEVLETVADSLVIAVGNALRFEEIQKFNVTLEKKVDDATRKLRNVNDKLVALDQTKDDFISMASHQLRTPLTSVKGYLSMVLEGDAGKIAPQQQKMLSQAFTSSQRMVYLIADLLNVSRLRTGKFVIDPSPTNLADVVEEEIAQLAETAKARELKLSYTKPKKFPEYMLDETKIRQVVMNFTDNALHYTKAGGKIQVSLKETPQSVEFTVQDNGIGIPRHEQHNLFTKFFRAGNARKARPDGTGLGLFMAKKVIIAQGGSIIFKSKENQGSTFGFSFSKSKLDSPIDVKSVSGTNEDALQMIRKKSKSDAKSTMRR